MKFTKTHEKSLREFMDKMDADGCLVCDEWVSGKGRFTTPRALPPFVSKEENGKTDNGAAVKFFNSNPRRKYVLVIDREAMFKFLFDNARLAEF